MRGEKVQLTCHQCGKAFIVLAASIRNGKIKGKYCSRACHDNSMIGEKRGVRVQRTCQQCGKCIIVLASQIRNGNRLAKYCSRKCHDLSQVGLIRPRTAVQKTCIFCGKSFFVPPCFITKNWKVRYCSQECRKKHTISKMITCTCKQCNKKFIAWPKQVERGNAKFCSKSCFDRAQTRYKDAQVDRTCPSCGKEFRTRPSRVAGGRGFFCSKKCYTKSVTGKPSPASRDRILRMYASGKFPKTSGTSIELLIMDELIKRGYTKDVDFFHQFTFHNKFSCDFAFPAQELIVECDGDYWHANPARYAGKELTTQQKEIAKKDKAKNAYIQTVGWALLRFWESDIKKDVKGCVDKIEEILLSC